MRLWSSQWDGMSAGSFASLLGHWHSCVRGGLLKQCLEVPVSVWLGEACARLLRNFWLHVCEAETEHRRECVSRNRARERHKEHNSNWCAYVCLHERRRREKKTESHGYCIRIQGNVQWGEKAIQVYRRVTQTHFLCVSKTEMHKHNNGLFGNILLPCNDLQLQPIFSHMGLEVEHCFNVLFISYRYIVAYFLLSVVKWWGCFI